MATNDTIQTRVPHALKQEAEALFAGMGLKLSDAIRMFLQQSINEGGIPFQPRAKMPNAETITALGELAAGKGKRSSLKEFKKFIETLEK